MSIPLGYLSDRFGRRLVLLLNVACTALAVVWYIVVGT